MISFVAICFASFFMTVVATNAKRGISYPSTDNAGDILNVNQTKSLISWQYDWGISPPPNLASSGIEYVPMQWGSGGIQNLSTAVKAQNAKVLLTFNEPDFDEQSNIDPNDAAKLWQQYIQPLKSSGLRIGAPAVSSGGTGIPWLTSFFAACSNCTFDFIPVHWYGEGAQGFYDYIWQVHGEFGNSTLWVTEFADTSLNSSDVSSFLNSTVTYLDSLDWIERYAWFGYFRPDNKSAYNFLNEDGSLNSLGQSYIGANTVVRTGPATNTASGAPEGGPTLASVSVGAGQVPTFLPNAASPLFLLDQLWNIVTVAAAVVVGMALIPY